jgi:hypothetical protein
MIMANPLLQTLGVSSKSNNKNIVEQFKEFKNSFQGDPQAKINELLTSGKVTQEQINQATEMANLIKGLMKK